MISRIPLKTSLLSSTFTLVLIGLAQTSNANVPKNSIDLANWAQSTTSNNKAASNQQQLQLRQRPQQQQQQQAYTHPVIYNPYSAMVNQVSYTPPRQSFNNYNANAGNPRGVRGLYSANNYPIGAANFTCVRQAAFDHEVPLRLMLAINSIERGRYNQKVANSNKSYDIGQFQINTIHLPKFAKYGATEYDIANRGCYNAQLAARLLSIALAEPTKKHLDIFTRASGYHSWTPKYNSIYRKKMLTYIVQWDTWLKDNNIPADIREV